MFRLFIIIYNIFIITTNIVHAADTDTYGIGARASALGGAVSAWACDPFAAYYNPAGLSLINGQMITAGASILQADINFNNFQVSYSGDPTINTNKNFSDETTPLIIPALGYAKRLNDKWAFGCAFYAPWGLAIKLDSDPSKNPSAYNAYESYANRVGITFSASHKINRSLSVGIGVTLGRSIAGGKNRVYISNDMGSDFPQYKAGLTSIINEADLLSQEVGGNAVTTTREGMNFYTQAALSATDEKTAKKYEGYVEILRFAYEYGIMEPSDVSGLSSPSHNHIVEIEMTDTFNYSFNAGIMYQASDIISLGLTYRGRCDAEFKGDIYYDGQKMSEGKIDSDHPEQIQGGIRFLFPNQRLSIETDIVWTHWHINDYEVISLKEGLTVSPLPGVYQTENILKTDRKWNNTIQVRVGIDYILNDMFVIRAGHFYDPSPIPDDTLDLVHPDADKRTFSAGLGIRLKKWDIDTFINYTNIEQSRSIGGESDNINSTYNLVNTESLVSINASGKIYGAGIAVSRTF